MQVFLFSVEVKNAGISSKDKWSLFGIFILSACGVFNWFVCLWLGFFGWFFSLFVLLVVFIWKGNISLCSSKVWWDYIEYKPMDVDFCLLNGMTFWNMFPPVSWWPENHPLKPFRNTFQYILFCTGTAKRFTGSLELMAGPSMLESFGVCGRNYYFKDSKSEISVHLRIPSGNQMVDRVKWD